MRTPISFPYYFTVTVTNKEWNGLILHLVKCVEKFGSPYESLSKFIEVHPNSYFLGTELYINGHIYKFYRMKEDGNWHAIILMVDSTSEKTIYTINFYFKNESDMLVAKLLS